MSACILLCYGLHLHHSDYSFLSPSYYSPLVFNSVVLSDGECHQTDNGSPTELSKVKIGLRGEREVARHMILRKKDTLISGNESNRLARIRYLF